MAAKDINEYIAAFPPEVQAKLEQVRKTIQSSATGAQECIAYGIPTFKMKKNLVHFAAYKAHIGFYPSPSGINKFKDELIKYKVTKGTIRFPLDRPIPYNLIAEIVAFRVEESMSRLK